MRVLIIGLCSLISTMSVSAKEKWELREEACSVHKFAAERVMCNDRQLTRMDAEMNELYQRLRETLEDYEFDDVREKQRTWLKIRNNCGSDYQCVFVLYQSRNAYLQQEIDGLHSDAYNQELYAGGPISCAQWSRVQTQSQNQPKQIKFVNITDGGRSVAHIDFDGSVNDIGWLEPEQSIEVSTFMTQPWMFTDGPGNCIEMFMPHPEISEFELRIPTMFFGGEND